MFGEVFGLRVSRFCLCQCCAPLLEFGTDNNAYILQRHPGLSHLTVAECGHDIGDAED